MPNLSAHSGLGEMQDFTDKGVNCFYPIAHYWNYLKNNLMNVSNSPLPTGELTTL